jgi:hypothetical protein
LQITDENQFTAQQLEIKMKLARGDIFGFIGKGFMKNWLPDFEIKFQQPDKVIFPDLQEDGL